MVTPVAGPSFVLLVSNSQNRSPILKTPSEAGGEERHQWIRGRTASKQTTQKRYYQGDLSRADKLTYVNFILRERYHAVELQSGRPPRVVQR